jgi:hypothetical protein
MKADNADRNTTLLRLVDMIAAVLHAERPPEKRAQSVITKVMNNIMGSYTVALVLSASYLLGHGDHWMPIGSCPYDYKVHQQQMGSKQHNAYEDPTTAHVIAEDAASPFVSSQQLDYQHRNDAVGELSPFEMAIMFTTDNVASSSTRALMFRSDHPSKGNQGLQPRQTMVIPQQFGDPPMRPDDTAESEDLEAWANFALGNFFPYDRYLHLLKGDTNWAKFLYWCEHKPRGALDEVAMKYLGNIHVRNLARQEMKKDLDIKVVRRGDMVHTNHDEEVGGSKQLAHDACTYT